MKYDINWNENTCKKKVCPVIEKAEKLEKKLSVGKPRHGEGLKVKASITIDPILRKKALEKYDNFSKAVEIALTKLLG